MVGIKVLDTKTKLSFEMLFDRVALKRQTRNGEIFPAFQSRGQS
jgi:hypothetical protein